METRSEIVIVDVNSIQTRCQHVANCRSRPQQGVKMGKPSCISAERWADRIINSLRQRYKLVAINQYNVEDFPGAIRRQIDRLIIDLILNEVKTLLKRD